MPPGVVLVAFIIFAVLILGAVLLFTAGHVVDEPPTLDTRNHHDD